MGGSRGGMVMLWVERIPRWWWNGRDFREHGMPRLKFVHLRVHRKSFPPVLADDSGDLLAKKTQNYLELTSLSDWGERRSIVARYG